MKNVPELSICIPTYNRSSLLTQSLNAVICQLDNTSYPSIEIVISNNASTDDTENVIRTIQANVPSIQLNYILQERNVGPDANIYNVIRHAKGKFVYILSDDDILLPGAVDKILSSIKSIPDLSAICPKISVFSSINEVRELVEFTSTRENDLLLLNKDKALKQLNNMITFVSCMAFRKEVLARADYSNKIGTNLLQSYVFIDALSIGSNFLFINKPCVAMRANDAIGYSLTEVFITHFISLMDYAGQIGYSKSTIREVLNNELHFVMGCIKHFKIKGTYRPYSNCLLHELKRATSLWMIFPWATLNIVIYMLTPTLGIRAFDFSKNKVKSFLSNIVTKHSTLG